MSDVGASLSVPDGLAVRGAAFWSEVVDRWSLSGPELAVLEKHCVLLDEIEALSTILAGEGLMSTGSAGQPIVHPAVAARHAAIRLAALLLGQLKLPDEDGAPGVVTPLSAQASRAAQARWGKTPPKAARTRRGSAA